MTRSGEAARRQLLPGGRLAGPMPLVIAVMMLLTVLATAAGLGIGGAARALGSALAGRLTVQIVEANPDIRTRDRDRLARDLRRLTGVVTVTVVDDAAVRDLLTPWLGSDGLDPDVPVPALIDVTLTDTSPATAAAVTALARTVTPAARVDRHADWLAPLAGLLDTLRWLAFGLVGLAAAATAAVVVLGARAALGQHRATIDVMHLMGANDRQIAQLFERGVALDALAGSLLGFIVAIGVLIVVATQSAAAGSALAGAATLGWGDWVVVALLPVATVALSVVAARIAVLRVLARIL